MKLNRRLLLSFFLPSTFFVFSWTLGCGVKGDPLPPERPAELGRGRPTYRRATEKIQIQKQGPDDEQDQDDRSEGEEDL